MRCSLKNLNFNLHGDTTQDTMQDERTEQLLEFCGGSRTRDEMQQFIGIANQEHFRKAILRTTQI
jgi:hypothetical protein